MMSRPVSLVLAFLALASSGCAFLRPGVEAKRVDPDEVHQDLNANALDGEELSIFARGVLHWFDLEQSYEEDPRRALALLHERVGAEPRRGLLYALAELSYDTARKLTDEERWSSASKGSGSSIGPRSSDNYLAAAIYAYLYLLGDDDPSPPDPYDRRFRWACDLYNRGLMRALGSEDGQTVVLSGGTRALPVGSIRIELDRASFPFPEERFSTFLPADAFRVSGLDVRFRDSGLGVPLIGLPNPLRVGEETPADERFLAKRASIAATAFLQVSGGIRDMAGGARANKES